MSNFATLIKKFWDDVKNKNIEPNFQTWCANNSHLLEPAEPVEEISGTTGVREARRALDENN